MLENNDQLQPEPVGDDATVHLPWDINEPAEPAADAVSADAEPVAAGDGRIDGDPDMPESETPDLDFEISNLQSETSNPEPAPAESSLDASDEASELATTAAVSEPASPPRTIPLTVLAARKIHLPIRADSPENRADPLSDVEPAAVETQDQPLPWSVAAAPDIIDVPIAPEADPQPPALAYAPAFLAVDDEGLPIPDEIADQLDIEIPSLPPETLEPEEITAAEDHRVTPSGSGIWTIPLMCLGIAILAACLIIPQADKNRRLAWEREGLRRNLEQLQKQVETNENFLDALATDRFLAKRLAQRQLNVVPAGSTVLELDGIRGMNASPFQLVTIPPPPPLPEYQPIGGRFAELCRNPQTQLYLIGASLFAIAAGLVLGRDRPTGA